MSFPRILSCSLLVFGTVSAARAEIDLEWRPASQTVFVGEPVDIGLYAVSDDPEMNQSIAAMDVIIAWDPVYMQLLGVDDTGGPGWLSSGFPSDPYGLNEVIPPQDGDGMYTAFAQFGDPVYATPAGTLVTTFQFCALGTTSSTIVRMLESAGSPVGHTVVYSGDVPNLDVTGDISSTGAVTIVACGSGDADADGDTDLHDFASFQVCFTGEQGGGDPLCECLFDSEPDGDVDFADFEDFAGHLLGPVP